MRAIQVSSLEGPHKLTVVDVPEPTPGTNDVLIEVHSVGVSFPDLLLTKGQYQLKPELPFISGADIAGVVVSGPAGFTPGQRVAGVSSIGGAADRTVLDASSVFPLPDELGFDEGAAMPMNYLTAHFALTLRAGLTSGEIVLVHGAAGGVGTASIQVAKALGAQVIAVTSTAEKADVALAAGADHAVMLEDFMAGVRGLTMGRGVDVVIDPVGGDIFTDSLRSLAVGGRHIVIGFAAGQGIPEVKVNRLLFNNIDIRGAAWGAYLMSNPSYVQEQWAELMPLMKTGAIKPPIGKVYQFEEYAQALIDMDDRKTLGKSVVRVRP